MLYAVIAILCLVVGAGFVYLLIGHKLKEKDETDKLEAQYWQEEKQKLQNNCEQLNNNIKELETNSTNLSANIELLENTSNNLRNNISILSEEINDKQKIIQDENKTIYDIQTRKETINTEYRIKQNEISVLEARRKEVEKNIESLFNSQQEAAEKYFEEAKKSAEQAFDTEIENIANNLEQKRQEAQNEYLKTLEETMNDFQEQISDKTQELRQLDEQLGSLRTLVATATAARKRQEEIDSQQDFYRLQLSEDDIAEIKKLREVLPYLRDKEPLNKVIYKVYYEKPYTDLVGRVIGQGKHTGIYKITNMENGMCYVGQSVNIAERWRQHIKRGVGAEPPTRNKLYPAMLSLGVENFTFELVEECEEKDLDEKEKYWQQFFDAQEYGYSIR